MDVASELGYVPQAAAKSLVQGRSTHIGLVLVQPHYQVFRDPYIPNVMTGLSSIAQSNGYRLIVEHINDLNDLNTIRNMLMSGEVAGIILSDFHWANDAVTPLIEDGYPIVSLHVSGKSGKYYSTNITRHANAKEVTVSLKGTTPRKLLITISDDGTGIPQDFDLSTLSEHGHFGLLGISERVALLSGRLRLHNHAEGGLQIQVEIPHPRTKSDGVYIQ